MKNLQTPSPILDALRHALAVLQANDGASTPERDELRDKIRRQIADIEAVSTLASGAKPPKTEKLFRNP